MYRDPDCLSERASRRARGLLVALALTATTAVGAPATLERAAVVRVHVIDVENGKVERNRTVFVAEGRVEAIVPEDTEVPDGTVVIEGRGRYLIPGLADLHVHHTASGAFLEPDEPSLYEEEDLLLYLLHGITTVRNMAGSRDDPLLAAKIESGRVLGPHFWTAGPPVVSRAVRTEADARREVWKQKRLGFDFLKMYCCFTPANRPIWDFILKFADEAGLPVVGHVPRELPLTEGLRMASIEHLEHLPEFFSGRADREVAARLTQLARSGVFVTPTLAPFESQRLSRAPSRKAFLGSEDARFISSSLWEREITGIEDGSNWFFSADSEKQLEQDLVEMMKFTRLLHRHGVPLLAGSDSGGVFTVIPGVGLHRELELLVRAGLTPADALRAATINAARFLGVQRVRGTVDVGKDADLVLLEQNPLEDISAVRTVTGVMIGTTWLDEENLSSLRIALRKR